MSFVYYINMSWVRELHLMRVISIHLSVWPFWPFLHITPFDAVLPSLVFLLRFLWLRAS
jgi:hypothetical protein